MPWCIVAAPRRGRATWAKLRGKARARRASSEADLAARWQLFLATAARSIYLATYRGVQLGTAMVTEAGKPVPLAD